MCSFCEHPWQESWQRHYLTARTSRPARGAFAVDHQQSQPSACTACTACTIHCEKLPSPAACCSSFVSCVRRIDFEIVSAKQETGAQLPVAPIGVDVGFPSMTSYDKLWPWKLLKGRAHLWNRLRMATQSIPMRYFNCKQYGERILPEPLDDRLPNLEDTKQRSSLELPQSKTACGLAQPLCGGYILQLLTPYPQFGNVRMSRTPTACWQNGPFESSSNESTSFWVTQFSCKKYTIWR